MLETDYIVERFALMAGLTIEEAASWTTVCEEAGDEIMRRAKAPDAGGAKVRLLLAAAALAFYRYSLCQAAAGDNFTVGDISVNQARREKKEAALALWRETEQAAADLLEDDGFVFGRTAGWITSSWL